MNNGKICIAVCAKTSDELFERIESSKPLSEIIELRFDCLEPDDVEQVRQFILKNHDGFANYITTFRPLEQGGHRDLTFEDRRYFWSRGYETELADVEEDLVGDTFSFLWNARICSFHDFNSVPEDLESVFKRLMKTNAEIIKVAVKVEDAVEAISLWDLFKFVKPGRLDMIPIAMGEAGKWTRILGLAHGAYLTYASLDADGGTAPGQITAHDMTEVFRVKELDEKTEVYGIIAGDTSYSMSPYIHNAAFKSARLNSVFVPLQVSDLEGFITRMVKPETREIELNFRGFSVTNPHKQAIIRHLDHVDDAAGKIGAVNTVKIVEGKLHGYNTDAAGFIKPLLEKFPQLKNARAAVVGAGGAARACIYSLKNAGAEVTVFARDLNKARDLANDFEINIEKLEIASNRAADFSDFDIVVNATPTGTRGDTINETVATAEQLNGVKLVYDLIYNPTETRLIHEARRAGAETLGGFDMLLAQAERQFQIWTGGDAPIKEMRAAAQRKINES